MRFFGIMKPKFFLILFFLFLAFVFLFLTFSGERVRTKLAESLSVKITPAGNLEVENQMLRARVQELGRNPRIVVSPEGKFIAADIYLNYPFTQKSKFLINAGARAGVREKMAALSGDALIGIVEQVFEDAGVIKTLFDPSMKVKVLIKNGIGKRIPALLEGGPILSVTLASKEIAVGNEVVNADEQFPFGWKIGSVKTIVFDPASAYAKAEVKLSDEFMESQMLLIYLGHESRPL